MRAAGKGLGVVARVIVLIASLVFLIIALGILLIVLDANPDNGVVQVVTDAARFLVGPFERLFTFDDVQLQTAINWGIGGFVWLIVGSLIASLLRRIGGRGRKGRAKA
jgi:membrane protein YdbS with pleckstrin-like domain